MTRDELNALADRVEQMDEPSQGMDAEIALAVGGWTQHHYDAWCHFQEAGDAANPPLYEPAPPNPYTRGEGSALRLVPEGWHASLICQDRRPPFAWYAGYRNARLHDSVFGGSTSFARAVTAAAIRAFARQL